MIRIWDSDSNSLLMLSYPKLPPPAKIVNLKPKLEGSFILSMTNE